MGNKKAIVTGASHGIGRGIAGKLAQEGYDLAVSYHKREEGARALAEEITREYGVACHVFQAALHEKDVPRAFFAQAVEALGGLDLLVCNAGATLSGSILDLNEEILDYGVNLDYKSYLLMTAEAASYMAEHEIRGSIVFVTSTHAYRAFPFDTLYGSIKAGLNRAVESLSLELGQYGIRVNAVAPGYIKIHSNQELPGYVEAVDALGALLPCNRIGVPADIGSAVAFLASDKAKYITGLTVKVDGGLTLPGMPESKDPVNNRRIWGYHEHYGFDLRKK